MKYQDLSGQRFGKLLVLKRVADTTHGHPRWAYKCDCGREGETAGNNLRNGSSRSCGCGAGRHSVRTWSDAAATRNRKRKKD